jgi:peptidoglycan hydrolase-like protein with peptidoglycan-binding domain
MTTTPPEKQEAPEEQGTRRIVRWVVIGAAALLLVGLMAYARGQKHHEGDEVGTHGVPLILLADRGRGEAGTTTTTSTTPEQQVADPAVMDLQTVMTRLGFYSGPIDGVYGAATTEAVKKLQTSLGVTADGVYGPSTDAALKGKARDVVIQVQTELTEYGYYSGPIDGDYGSATQEAVKQLQQDLGVTADGRVGPETVDAFNKAVAGGTLTPAHATTTTSTTATTTTTASTTTASTTTTK